MTRGRPSFDVCAKDMRLVEQLIEDGASLDQVAAEIGISRKTLSKHFASVIADSRKRVREIRTEDDLLVRLLRLSRSRKPGVALAASIELLRTKFGW